MWWTGGAGSLPSGWMFVLPSAPAGGAGPPSTRATPDPVPEIFAGSTGGGGTSTGVDSESGALGSQWERAGLADAA